MILVGPTAAKMPLAIQQKVLVNESTNLSAENDHETLNIYDKPNVLQPYANVQPLELHRHFANFFSTGPTETKSLAHLMLTKSATAIGSENQAVMSLSRSLQDISDIGQSSASLTDLDVPAHASSQDNLLQVPAIATNAMLTTTSLPRPKSTLIGTNIEGIYDHVASPEYHTLPSG